MICVNLRVLRSWPQSSLTGWRFVNPAMRAQYGTDSIPETAENVTEDFSISSVDQDIFALRSHTKASKAQTNGHLAWEINAVTISQRKGRPIIVTHDEHPRATSIEGLAHPSVQAAQLRPVIQVSLTMAPQPLSSLLKPPPSLTG
jgi:acetyl-CoA acetyltransferase